jgi:ribosome-associated protein
MTGTLKAIHDIMMAKQTENIVSINVSDHCVFTDFFIIGQCRSSRHLLTVCDALMGWAKSQKYPLRVQGRNEDTSWIVLDLGDSFVHLFLEDSRKMFDLESLWSARKSYPALTTDTVLQNAALSQE